MRLKEYFLLVDLVGQGMHVSPLNPNLYIFKKFGDPLSKEYVGTLLWLYFGLKNHGSTTFSVECTETTE